MRTAIVLDIGGEGRHPRAWNLNPSPVKTLGAERGALIPRRIAARAEAIPLLDASVHIVIVERTPLREPAWREIRRVAAHGSLIILRHARSPWSDPHHWVSEVLPGRIEQTVRRLDQQLVQETRIWLNGQGT